MLAAVLSVGCEETPQEQHAEPAPPMGGGARGGGGGGDVAVGAPEAGSSQGTGLEVRYQKALDLVKKKDWDAAYAELQDVADRGAGTPVAAQAQKQLQTVTANLLTYPPTPVQSLLAAPEIFSERSVTLRGSFQGGGAVGASTYYFWVKQGRTVQCRYPRLSLPDKQRILKVKDGSPVLVRGTVKPPWGTNPDPYLDLTLFRAE